MICYCAEHNESKKLYIGISDRVLAIRRSEHESHSTAGANNAIFHAALRQHGKDNFTWRVLAEGDESVIRFLERALIGELRTLHPRGFNSRNDAEPPMTDETLSFCESMDAVVEEMDMANDLQSHLVKNLSKAIENKCFSEKANELMKPLLDHLKSGPA